MDPSVDPRLSQSLALQTFPVRLSMTQGMSSTKTATFSAPLVAIAIRSVLIGDLQLKPLMHAHATWIQFQLHRLFQPAMRRGKISRRPDHNACLSHPIENDMTRLAPQAKMPVAFATAKPWHPSAASGWTRCHNRAQRFQKRPQRATQKHAPTHARLIGLEQHDRGYC